MGKLALGRAVGEAVVIGDSEVTVEWIVDRQVTLRVDALGNPNYHHMQEMRPLTLRNGATVAVVNVRGRGRYVTLAIEAPREMIIYRKELGK